MISSRQRPSSERGTSLIEFGLFLPLIVVLGLGVVEVSWALLDGHVVTRMAREGSNLISRDASLTDAASAMDAMRSRPLNFGNGTSKLILSVIRNIDTVGAANYNFPIMYQRYVHGTAPGNTKLNFSGGSFPPPDYQATNPEGNTALRVTNLNTIGSGLTVPLGGFVYVAEIYSTHQTITPFGNFGFSMPGSLYSIAWF
jgi:hypothetical protein